MKFVQLAKSLKEEGLAPVYLVEGEETFFRDHAVSAVRAACALSNPALNDVRYEGDSLKGDALTSFVSDLYTLPFFDERRLVRAYEFYPTERDWESVLKPYVQSPCPSTVLVIVNNGAKKGAELKRKGGVTFVDCGRESEETLSRWLFGVARRAELELDGESAALMVRYCNLDAARMKLEVEKLRLLLGHGGRVTRQIVEEYVAKDVEYKIYELTQAASRKNAKQFFEILGDLLEKGYDESSVLSALVSHFRTLSEIASMRGTDAELSAVLGIKPYAVKKNREALARLGQARAKSLYLELYTLSADMRSGLYKNSGALSAAIAKIFFA